MGRMAILGGTGPEGLGLALRFALAGEEVVIGSRKLERAETAAAEAKQELEKIGCRAPVSGRENADSLDGADTVVLSFPYSGVRDLLPQLVPALQGKLVIDVVNPLLMEKRVFRLEPVAAGSAGEEIQEMLPDSPVVCAFKNESAEELRRIEEPLRGDVIVCGNHPDATARVLDLIARVRSVRGVDAGALVNARALEAITALLLNVNRRHRAVTAIQILGLPELLTRSA